MLNNKCNTHTRDWTIQKSACEHLKLKCHFQHFAIPFLLLGLCKYQLRIYSNRHQHAADECFRFHSGPNQIHLSQVCSVAGTSWLGIVAELQLFGKETEAAVDRRRARWSSYRDAHWFKRSNLSFIINSTDQIHKFIVISRITWCDAYRNSEIYP